MKLWKIIVGVLGAFLGIRASKSAQEDFAQHALWPYVLAGIVFILIFISALTLIVHFVLQ